MNTHKKKVEHALLCADAGSGKAIKVLAAEVRAHQSALRWLRDACDVKLGSSIEAMIPESGNK